MRQRLSPDPLWMDLARAAAYTSLSVRTLRRYLSDAAHPLPHYLVGGKLLFDTHEIDEWVRGFARVGNEVDKLVDELLGDVKRPQTQQRPTRK